MKQKVFAEIIRDDGSMFTVESRWNDRQQKMQYGIYKHEPYMVVVAMEFTDESFLFLWDYTPVFDSFVRAVAYMKANINLLV